MKGPTVRAAWALEDVEAQYSAFVSVFSQAQATTPAEAFAAQIRLVQEWRRFPLLDPGLPRQLLPPRWTGSRAAEVFRERHAGWAPRADAAWAELTRER